MIMISEVPFYGMRPFVHLLLSGVFERFPKLKFVITEGSAAARLEVWRIGWEYALDHPWFGGGLGGHNGLKDISSRLSTQDYWRLRIGIGHPRVAGSQQPVADFVLHRPRKEEQVLIEDAIEKSLRIMPLVCEGKFDIADSIQIECEVGGELNVGGKLVIGGDIEHENFEQVVTLH